MKKRVGELFVALFLAFFLTSLISCEEDDDGVDMLFSSTALNMTTSQLYVARLYSNSALTVLKQDKGTNIETPFATGVATIDTTSQKCLKDVVINSFDSGKTPSVATATYRGSFAISNSGGAWTFNKASMKSFVDFIEGLREAGANDPVITSFAVAGSAITEAEGAYTLTISKEGEEYIDGEFTLSAEKENSSDIVSFVVECSAQGSDGASFVSTGNRGVYTVDSEIPSGATITITATLFGASNKTVTITIAKS